VGAGDESTESCRVVLRLCNPFVIHSVCHTRVVFRRSYELLCGGYKWVSRFRNAVHFAHDGQVSTDWRCPGSMARRARDSVALLQRSSACWMTARMGRLSASVRRMQSAIIHKALVAESTRRVWGALPHQTRAQYSAVECTRALAAIRRVVPPAPQPEPASRLRSVTPDLSFLRSNSRRRRYLSGLSNVTWRYLGWSWRARFSC